MDPDTPSLSVRSGSEMSSPDNDVSPPSNEDDDEYEEVVPQKERAVRKKRKFAEAGECYKGKLSKVGYEFVRVDEVSRSIRAGLEDALSHDIAPIVFDAIAKHFKSKLFFEAGDDSVENKDLARFLRVWKPTRPLVTKAAIDIVLNDGDRALKDGQAVMLHTTAGDRLKICVRRVLEAIVQHREGVLASGDITDAQRACPRKLRHVLAAGIADLLKFVRILVLHRDQAELGGSTVDVHRSADALYTWTGSRGSGIVFDKKCEKVVHRALKEALERC